MKIIYLFISSIFLFFIGCSTTYKVTGFKSSEEFYNNFNNFMKDKDGEVTLRNDSALSFENGAEVKDDSLMFFNHVTESIEKSIPLNEIKKTDYYGTDYKHFSAHLLLKNGNKVDAKNIKLGKDSMKYLDIRELDKVTAIPLNKVGEVSVSGKKLRGIIGGIVIGGLAGIIYSVVFDTGNPQENTSGIPFTYGGIAGGIIGGIVGYLIGWNYHYDFNP